jgi:hypothetical protein
VDINMGCEHKFSEFLNLERIDFEPTTLIVGTFNPSWPAGNNAEWFYGRTHDENGNQNNNFWDVLPQIYGEPSLINAGPVNWKAFCAKKQIAITDLISNIEDADPNIISHVTLLKSFADDDIADKFFDFDLVNIVRLLRENPTITNVYITRGISESFWKNKIFALKKYCLVKNIRLIPLLTPSGYAYMQQGKYNRLNPQNQLNLSDYILMRWNEVWHF